MFNNTIKILKLQIFSEASTSSRTYPKESSSHLKAASTNKTANLNTFCLEDFETCQSSPFDVVELSTLNVIEELREVLSRQAKSDDKPLANVNNTNLSIGHDASLLLRSAKSDSLINGKRYT